MLKHGDIFLLSLKRYLSVHVLKPLDSVALQKPINQSFDVNFRNVHKKFKLILDVRSPSEFLVDHLPGAVNIPILGNRERSEVGKVYNKDDPVTARLLGSSLIMKNLSQYLQQDGILFRALHEKISDINDQIIVYCARGGQRSRSVAIVLSEIGFTKQPIHILEGGYRAYRKEVLTGLGKLPDQCTFVGICGLTGTAKTKVLHGLRRSGETVLDLEDLAQHKGSVFGACVDGLCGNGRAVVIQPSQKSFESHLWSELTDIVDRANVRRCRNGKPIVWIECESRNIGSIVLCDSIWRKMQNSKRIIIEASIEERIKHILADYCYLTDRECLSTTNEMITWLSKNVSPSLMSRWHTLADSGKYYDLVESLLRNHYDPVYSRNRKQFIDCTDRSLVQKVSVERLDSSFIEENICPELVNISKSWLEE